MLRRTWLVCDSQSAVNTSSITAPGGATDSIR